MKFCKVGKALIIVLMLLFVGVNDVLITFSKPIGVVIFSEDDNTPLINDIGVNYVVADESADKDAESKSIIDKVMGKYISRAFGKKTHCLFDDNRFYYDKKYAVIIVGYYSDEQHYTWFTRDAQRQYNVLTGKYGFNDSDVYMLLTLREEWATILGMDSAIIDYDATEENIIMVFDYLREIIDEDDLLYVVVINHGGDDHHIYFSQLDIQIDFWQGIFAHDTYFGLEHIGDDVERRSVTMDVLDNYSNSCAIDNRVYDYELKDYTNGINARRIIFVLQPCFSGGFINDLSKKNHVIITASTEVQPAFAPFIGYFYHGLNGSADDSNNDGRLSLGEIYEYTANQVYQWIDQNPNSNMGRPQHPLIEDNDNEIGSRYNVWFGYDPYHKYNDGYVSAKIYNLSYEEI